ncbi:cis-prenyltransferase [Lithohypha guttulata]|uniref:cis-prenyltransferase n=1 Tax=Lithohypha guttulata TaxID=1690604 RepID=UPI002DDE9902|nr:cis-prenyltransferase [Lithohypha guttulata]KAK5099892.1 cis-prenyltransferase [Lithohypha guttulata]
MASKQLSTIRKWVLSSPPAEWALNQLRELLIGAIKQGEVPRHVAFVMDGNRRYARSRRIETVEGHNLGFEALARILEVCYKSGVHTVTIYAFSIENFKRSRYEVDALMDMAKIKLTQLSQHGELLDRYGARIRILGQRELLKPDVLEAMDRACDMTKHNTETVLNVCFPYTSRDEITTAIRRTVQEYSKPVKRPRTEQKRLSPFTEERITQTLKTQHRDSFQAEERLQDLEPKTLSSPSLSSASLSDFQTRLSRSQSLDAKDHDHEADTSSESSSATTNLHYELLSPSSASSPPTSYAGSPQSKPQLRPSNTTSPEHSQKELSSYPSPESITSGTITSHLFTADDPPLDLMIRTSGVERLSDFMLWQCHEETRVVFLDVLWPEFDLWQFLPVLWEWQWRGRKEEQRRRLIEGRLV